MNDESRPKAAPEQSAQTATSTLPRRCDYTDAACRCQADEPSLDDCREVFVHELAAQLRRRREAASRLVPLADGRRDVLDSRPTDGRSEW